MKKVKKRALVAMISATAFFAEFANAADDENKSSNNPSRFNMGKGKAARKEDAVRNILDASRFNMGEGKGASALFTGDAFSKKDDGEKTEQQLLKQQASKKCTKKTKKTNWWASKRSDATDGPSPELMSSGVTPHSDELKSPTRHTSYMSKEEFMASIGHNGSESQDTKHTPMPPKSPKSPDQVHIEILKALAKAALGFASIQDDKQRAEIQRQQTDANIMLGEDFLSKQDLMAEPSFGPILAEVAKVEAKTLKDIECTEGKLSLLNGKPVLVTSEIVNHNSNKYLKLTISSIGDKSISDLFDEDTLKRSGLAMGSLDPISSLKMISKGELPFPLEVDNANGAFFNAINNSDDDAVDTCILINTEDTTDILLRNPEYGKYSDQQELALRKMTIKNNQLAKAFAEEKAEKEHYKETNKKVCDEHDKLDDEYKKIKNDFDTQTTNFAKANKSAQKLRAKLRRTTQLANDAKAAGLKVDGNGMPDIPDQDLRDAANGTFKKADGKTLSYYSDDDGA